MADFVADLLDSLSPVLSLNGDLVVAVLFGLHHLDFVSLKLHLLFEHVNLNHQLASVNLSTC